MCIKAVEADPWQICNVSDCFVMLEEMWNDSLNDDDHMVGWPNDYENRQEQRAKMKEELLHITWHPVHVMDWCISENQERRWR